MIRFDLLSVRYRWKVRFFLAKSCYHTAEILNALRGIGCDDALLSKAEQNLSTCTLNTGLTYSNPERRESVLVVALTSTPADFANSLVHELSHLRRHIEKAYNIDPDSEEPCYLIGEIMQSVYVQAHELLCPHCRKTTGRLKKVWQT